MNTDEARFSVEYNLEQQNFVWSDKYRPRKPRFFNRVHTVCNTDTLSYGSHQLVAAASSDVVICRDSNGISITRLTTTWITRHLRSFKATNST